MCRATNGDHLGWQSAISDQLSALKADGRVL
jgi:hypothetical protein